MTPNEKRNLSFLRSLRDAELLQAIPYMESGSRVLEIGAGAGWQAAVLSERGFKVTAVDVPESHYSMVREHPVIPYDGKRLPLGDASVDIIFSSNVLEHVNEPDELLADMKRVLAPGGIAIHILPTPAWRFWDIVAAYPSAARKLLFKRYRSAAVAARSNEVERSRLWWLRHLRGNIWPARHGARGSGLSEIYWFSKYRWLRQFGNAGWRTELVKPMGVFYTGQFFFGDRLPVAFRRALGAVIGSACTIFVLRPEMKKRSATSSAQPFRTDRSA